MSSPGDVALYHAKLYSSIQRSRSLLPFASTVALEPSTNGTNPNAIAQLLGTRSSRPTSNPPCSTCGSSKCGDLAPFPKRVREQSHAGASSSSATVATTHSLLEESQDGILVKVLDFLAVHGQAWEMLEVNIALSLTSRTMHRCVMGNPVLWHSFVILPPGTRSLPRRERFRNGLAGCGTAALIAIMRRVGAKLRRLEVHVNVTSTLNVALILDSLRQCDLSSLMHFDFSVSAVSLEYSNEAAVVDLTTLSAASAPAAEARGRIDHGKRAFDEIASLLSASPIETMRLKVDIHGARDPRTKRRHAHAICVPSILQPAHRAALRKLKIVMTQLSPKDLNFRLKEKSPEWSIGGPKGDDMNPHNHSLFRGVIRNLPALDKLELVGGPHFYAYPAVVSPTLTELILDIQKGAFIYEVDCPRLERIELGHGAMFNDKLWTATPLGGSPQERMPCQALPLHALPQGLRDSHFSHEPRHMEFTCLPSDFKARHSKLYRAPR